MSGLPLEEDTCTADSDRKNGAEQHERKAVDQGNGDIQQNVLHSSARVLGEVLICQRYRDEQDQWSLDQCSEEAPVPDQDDCGNYPDDVETGEG